MSRILLLCLVFAASAAPALEIDCVDPFASDFAEAAFVAAAAVVDVAVDDGLALGATAGEILILDVTDPAQPTQLATWTMPSGAVAAVALARPWAVVAGDGGLLHVLDLTDPTAPVALPVSGPLAGPVVALDLAGDRIAAATGSQTVEILRIVPGEAPQPQWSSPVPSSAIDLVLGAGHVYAVCEFEALVTFDAATGAVTATTPMFESLLDGITLVDGHLVAAETYFIWLDAGMGEYPQPVQRLRTISLDDPAQPVPGGSVDWPGSTGALQVGTSGSQAMVWDGRSLAAVATPAELPSDVHGMLSREQTVLAVAGEPGLTVLAVEGGFRCYRVVTAATPAPRDGYREESFASASRIYAASEQWILEGRNYHWGAGAYQGWAGSLTLFDLTDDTSVRVIHSMSSVDYVPPPRPLAATGGVGPGDDRVYYRTDGDVIWVSPVETYAPRVALPVNGLFAASGGWAFVAADDTLYHVNCWDVAAPYVAGAYPTTGTVSAIHTPYGSVVVLGYEDGRVEVYQFAGSSVDIETYQVAGAVRSLAVDAELILVGTDTDVQSIHAFAIGYPGKDRSAAKDFGDVRHLADTLYPVTSLAAEGRHVYAAQGDRGLRILHATPDETVDLGYGGPALASVGAVRTEGNRFALVAIEPNLARVLTAHCRGTGAPDPAPAVPEPVVTVAPNPFNPRTTVSFDLDRAQRVVLELYDLRGRRVRALAAGEYAAGRQEVSWDGRDDAGRDCGSGVYLARLRLEAGATSRAKLTLVR